MNYHNLKGFWKLAFVCWISLLFSEYCTLGVESVAQKPNFSVLGEINIKDCGAFGDGKHNDTAAFRTAAAKIEQAGGGKLIIPPGVYIVGEQKQQNGGPFYLGQPIFSVKHVSGLIIEGKGATLRFAPGLRFGSFDLAGKKVTPDLPFLDRSQAAGIGPMIEILESKDILICNLELDGNSGKLILGGEWGDKGRQLSGYGIRLYNNINVLVENVHIHHQPLDGIIIGWDGLKADDNTQTPHLLVNVISEYNARQGLSWVGGRGLTAVNCKFNHTGKGALVSSPGAGLDIETEGAVIRDGLFVNCEFVDNSGCGVVSDCLEGGHTKFVNCLIWGTGNWSIWNTSPGVSFQYCTIYGSIVYGYGSADPLAATRFENCHFEDPVGKEYGAFRGPALVTRDGGESDNITFDKCSFKANKIPAFLIRGISGHVYVKNCQITHCFDAPDQSWQSCFDSTVIENTHFMESFSDDVAVKDYFIKVNGGSIKGKVIVDGPLCKWEDANGMQTGEIK